MFCLSFHLIREIRFRRNRLSAEDWFRLRQSSINILEMFLNTLNTASVTDDSRGPNETFSVSHALDFYECRKTRYAAVQSNHSCGKFPRTTIVLPRPAPPYRKD
ncbi:hypothetical protein AVEN_84808-1 [Araneus ventricosus]|uniref:Uncharacterized protein n=1 Tax=Araneus ventricosus TaxID=182803 RepID=A0A4Y2IZN6_ARAVE|nr:hypothetical protein AVEN_84808-1 [Araneus ventricosus]